MVAHMMQRRLILAMAAAGAALLAGCSRIKKKDQAARLKDTLTAYTGAIRWGHYETARAFAKPRDGAAVTLDPAALAGLKVTGYSVRINRVNEEGDEANVSLSFTYYQETRGTVRTAVQDATWYYEEAGERWLLDGGLPDFQL